MDANLSNFLVQIVPTILSTIKDIMSKNGNVMPTDAEVIAKLKSDANKITAVGQAWLDAHK